MIYSINLGSLLNLYKLLALKCGINFSINEQKLYFFILNLLHIYKLPLFHLHQVNIIRAHKLKLLLVIFFMIQTMIYLSIILNILRVNLFHPILEGISQSYPIDRSIN